MNGRRRTYEPAALTVLRGWLRAAKGRRTFYSLHLRAVAGGKDYEVSECTLRRALDGRLPSRRTVTAFAHGAGADETKAAALWEAAASAMRPPAAARPALYVPGRFTTRGGRVRAMVRMRAAAGNPSLRALASCPEAGGRIPRSTLHLILVGRREPSREQLAAFAAACHAGPEATNALLAGHAWITDGPPQPLYPCEAAELADNRRLVDEEALAWRDEQDLDWYEQQLLDEEEARFRQQMTDAEKEITAREQNGWTEPPLVGRDLRAELTAITTCTQTTGSQSH
ncbi:hypothetical protein ACF064_35525 [Streptomyces sp. NPDC015492]|uniref:hypothetical protein n=1 Tax=Streptomyces sp. NPDC015492 TaxID=3364958 RepID=UPI0036FF1572